MPDDRPTVDQLTGWMREHMTQDERALGRLEGRLAGMDAKLDQIIADHGSRLGAHGVRIRALELWRAYLAGIGAALVAAVGYLLYALSMLWRT